MLYRGNYVALDEHQIGQLRSRRGDPARRSMLVELEEAAEIVQATDKAWYILFNTFQNSSNEQFGQELEDSDHESLSLLFLGARRLHRADFYVINWIPENDVAAVNRSICRVGDDTLRERYFNVNRDWFFPGDYHGSEEQFEYVRHWFGGIRGFFQRIAESGQHAVFSAQYQ